MCRVLSLSPLLFLLLVVAPTPAQEANPNIRFGMPTPAAMLFSFLARNSYLLDGGLVAGLASPFHSDVAWMLHWGSAFCSEATPAAVSLVPDKKSRRSLRSS